MERLNSKKVALIISHQPAEYTSSIWQEETGKAVIKLWHSGKISAGEFWAFAYGDIRIRSKQF